MNTGVLYGIGVGPGDPELVTVKGAALLAKCRHIFVPTARISAESLALSIARRYVSQASIIRELVFPMATDRKELQLKWHEAAMEVTEVLKTGEDACFITIGDPLLYSTCIYLMRAAKEILPNLKVVTVPGITSFCAAASLTNFPIGEGRESITIIPVSDNLDAVNHALLSGGTVVLMKIGKHLHAVLDCLGKARLLDKAVFVAHAGQPAQRIETDLQKLKQDNAETGYLSVILVHAGGEIP